MIVSENFKKRFFTPVSGESLAVFRFCFGFLLVWGVVLDLFYSESGILMDYILPEFHLKHWLFRWVEPWPTLGLAYLHYFALLASSFCVMIGLFTRWAVLITVCLFGYIFFADMAYYLNHYYLMIISGILLLCLPSERKWSIDAIRHPEWKEGNVPQWTVWSVQAMVEVVLLYAGFVKLNSDWLQLEPLGMWLRDRAHWHFFGDLVFEDWFVAIGAYGTVALHILGAPLLLYRKTRLWAFGVYCAFHLMNSYTFDIGIFPFFTIFATLIFFPANWPTQFWTWLVGKKEALEAYYKSKPRKEDKFYKYQTLSITAVLIFLIIQILLPLRPLLYPGNVAWTQEGHQFAWRMKLRDIATVGTVFRVYSPDMKQEWFVRPHEMLPYRHSREIGNNPEYTLQFAHYLADKWRRDGHGEVEVYVKAYASLNGRKPALLIDPRVNLAKEKWGLGPAKWILPMNDPLPPKDQRMR